MKKIGYTILTVIILGVTYGIIKEMNFTPLKKQDFKTLFPNYNGNAKIAYHKDYIGWSQGDYFELFVYRLKDVLVDSAYPKIEDNWEYVSLPDTVEVTKWINCPIDSIIQLKYRNELSWIINKGETDEEKAFENCLNDSNSYYSCIYINELKKYLLLYCTSKRIMYYMRQNGF